MTKRISQETHGRPRELAEKRGRPISEVVGEATRRRDAASTPRCRYAKEICRRDRPALCEIAPGHIAACHFAEELQLTGV